MNRDREVQATYDSRTTGAPYTISIQIDDQQSVVSQCHDPFYRSVAIVPLRTMLLALLRGRTHVVVEVKVDAPPDLIEDVLELDDNYRGWNGSPRRRSAERDINDALADFARPVWQKGRLVKGNEPGVDTSRPEDHGIVRRLP